MPCRRQVTIRLCTMPTCRAPSSVQQKFQFLRPIGIARRARSRWLVSIGTSGSVRNTSRPRRRSRRAGRDRGGYRHPDFQFLPSGSVHPRLPELLDALARPSGLAPPRDRSGWERAYWLYQPRGRLSAQALALRAAAPEQLRANAEHFAALDTAARTPAELFLADPQAVIDLAHEDSAPSGS